ncbi:zinc finger, CCHC-type containing protein [Tanacetum coccineum]
MAEDASSKKFLVSNFTNYKMTDSRSVIEQYNELFGILGRFTQHKMNMDEAIQVFCIIDKLLLSWKDFKHTLKHKKEELTFVELGSHQHIDESLRVQDIGKPKGNNVAGPSVVNMVEHNNSLGGWLTQEQRSCVYKIDVGSSRYESLNDGLLLHMRNDVNGPGAWTTEDISGSVVPEEIIKEVVIQHPELELRKSKRNRTSKNFRPEFQLYLIEEQGMRSLTNTPIALILRTTRTHFDEAIKSQDVALWKEAINDEIDSIMGNNTWVLVDLPTSCKPLVARISTIRLLIALALIHNLIIHQMDVKTSLLNGELDEEVYMNQTQGFIMPGNEDMVCKLIKSLYGLKHAPKQWHQKFDEVVLSNGYLLNQADKCVYNKFNEPGKEVNICLYVDDMLIFSTDQVQVDLAKEFLSSRFSIKDIGGGLMLSWFKDCKYEMSTPMDTSRKLMPNNGQALSQLSILKSTILKKFRLPVDGCSCLVVVPISWASREANCNTSSITEIDLWL